MTGDRTQAEAPRIANRPADPAPSMSGDRTKAESTPPTSDLMRPGLRVGGDGRWRPQAKGPLCAELDGFSLHANTWVAPRDRERVMVVERVVVGDARLARVHLGAAEFLGGHDLAGRRLHERRAAEEDRALITHDDRLVAHGRHVGAAGGARPHHDGNLGNAARRELRLVVEDAPEVVAIGKHLVLQRQECAAGINQIQTGQVIFERDFLRAQVLFDRDRVVGAALHRRVIHHDHAGHARHASDPGDDSPGGQSISVKTAVYKLRCSILEQSKIHLSTNYTD